jgi:hypothetical protein
VLDGDIVGEGVGAVTFWETVGDGDDCGVGLDTEGSMGLFGGGADVEEVRLAEFPVKG